jgi:hypothetical protein
MASRYFADLAKQLINTDPDAIGLAKFFKPGFVSANTLRCSLPEERVRIYISHGDRKVRFRTRPRSFRPRVSSRGMAGLSGYLSGRRSQGDRTDFAEPRPIILSLGHVMSRFASVRPTQR